MIVYQVWSLDVWGHAPGDCVNYGCPCVTHHGPEDTEHDENRCDCHYEVNDRSRLKTIDLPLHAADKVIIEALIGDGLLNVQARQEATIDDPSCDGESIYVADRDGRPIFQLEKEES